MYYKFHLIFKFVEIYMLKWFEKKKILISNKQTSLSYKIFTDISLLFSESFGIIEKISLEKESFIITHLSCFQG